jgi:hypothetical protein
VCVCARRAAPRRATGVAPLPAGQKVGLSVARRTGRIRGGKAVRGAGRPKSNRRGWQAVVVEGNAHDVPVAFPFLLRDARGCLSIKWLVHSGST